MKRLSLLVLLLASITASASADEHHFYCGTQKPEELGESGIKAQTHRLIFSIALPRYRALQRSLGREWKVHPGTASCGLAGLVASEWTFHATSEIEPDGEIRTHYGELVASEDLSFSAMGASWFIGRYHCIAVFVPERGGGGKPNREERVACTHTGRYGNHLSWIESWE